jgi:hypothetical protein
MFFGPTPLQSALRSNNTRGIETRDSRVWVRRKGPESGEGIGFGEGIAGCQ